MIAVEFDKIYAVSHPGRAATWGFGLFTGSNGYWRSTLLRDLRMNGDMLTEDIDSSLRAVSRGAKTVHDLNVVSYELAPTTLKSFWNQRLRWAQGWAQASSKHIVLTFNKPTYGARSMVNRAGLVSLLFIRELSYYLVTQYCCLVLSILILDFPTKPEQLLRVLFFQYPVAYWLFIIRCVRKPPELSIADHLQCDMLDWHTNHHLPRQVGVCYKTHGFWLFTVLSGLPCSDSYDWSLRACKTGQ